MPANNYQGPHPHLRAIKILERAGMTDEEIRAVLGDGISKTTYWRRKAELKGVVELAEGVEPAPIRRRKTCVHS